MTTLSVLTVLWSVAAAAFLGLMIYRTNLANHDTDQLFLNDEDNVSSTHHEHDRVVRLQNTLLPLCKGIGGAAVVLTFAIAGVWLSHIFIAPNV